MAGKPILTAQQIEDVVAFLATLRDAVMLRRRFLVLAGSG